MQDYQKEKDRFARDMERFEHIKHDFTFGIAPAKDEDKIVLHNEGSGYAHRRVRIVHWPDALRHKYTMRDVAIVAASGYIPFGWRNEGNLICIHTD